MHYIYLLILLLTSFSCAASDEIEVHLSSKESLKRVQLHSIQDEESGFDKNYLKQLEVILSFDLNHNGRTQVSSNAKECDFQVQSSIAAKKLNVTVTTNKTKSAKGLQGLLLSGNLNKDRCVIHQAADAIHASLFGTSGIASTHLLYTVRNRKNSDSSQWVSEVWESDYDGANAKQLTHEGHLCVTPTFIPAKEGSHPQHYLYVSYKIGQPKIFAGSLVNGEMARLTYLKGNQLMPALSPKKNLIAFISDITGNPDLFVQDFSVDEGVIGKPRQIFTAPHAAQGCPTFDPTGKKIAFVSNKDGTARVYILPIPAVGTSIKELQPLMITKQNRDNTCPVWSPDGKKIAYSASTLGVRQIWIYDLASGVESQLTDGPGHKENPSWAPNSLHLIFNSSTSSSSELFMINLNQKRAVKITNGPGEKQFPSWEPYFSGTI